MRVARNGPGAGVTGREQAAQKPQRRPQGGDRVSTAQGQGSAARTLYAGQPAERRWPMAWTKAELWGPA